MPASRVHGVTTALYRRYRPDTFAEVIGQEHVTGPLRQALRSGQINHAYLFSGPRGCGKTTSARILARCLNCAEGPTDTPCGHCDSCVELARGGPGSLDVVEIDAASHGGVDDARELRERATFAPSRDRYKVFILDEAHMVSPQGFNALLKIVEEPPPHVMFIFATTEPDKVIGTIRSRTHHYPFRLVPPDILADYLEKMCAAEHVPVGPGVLPLVVRAGAGSVRDSLSVLDQLIAGSGPEGLRYDAAVALLGYTPAALLDDLVDALAAFDGASAFRVVERVIETGHEPRRFVEDVLERLRDLIVLAAAGDAATAALRDVPADQLDQMRLQAGRLGVAQLSHSADLVNDALTEMTGATSPRLHLELLVARLLLPAADSRAYASRLERVERALGAAPGVHVGSGPMPGPGAGPVRDAGTRPAGVPAADVAGEDPLDLAPPLVDEPGDEPVAVVGPSDGAPATGAPSGDVAGHDETEPSRSAPPARTDRDAVDQPSSAVGPATPALPASPAPGEAAAAQDTEVLRRRWPEVLETVGRLRKATRALVDPGNAQVAGLDATTLHLAFGSPGLATTFRTGTHADVVARAVRETLGFDVRVEPVVSGGPATGASARAATTPAVRAATPGAISPEQAAASWDGPVDAAQPAPARPAEGSAPPSAAPSGTGRAAASTDWPDDASPDDSQPAGSGLTGPPLIVQMLGGLVIDEQVDGEPE